MAEIDWDARARALVGWGPWDVINNVADALREAFAEGERSGAEKERQAIVAEARRRATLAWGRCRRPFGEIDELSYQLHEREATTCDNFAEWVASRGKEPGT